MHVFCKVSCFLCSMNYRVVCSIDFLLALNTIALLVFVRGSKFYGLGCANVACSMALMLVVDGLGFACRTYMSILG